MSKFFAHYLNNGYYSNPFVPYQNYPIYMNSDTSDKYLFFYDYIIGAYVRTYQDLPIWQMKDNLWGVEWQLTTYSFQGYPVLTAYAQGYTWYFYHTSLGNSGFAIYKQLGFPVCEKTKLKWDQEDQRVTNYYEWQDCFFCNGSNFSSGMQFSGKGIYQGQTMQFSYVLKTPYLWKKQSSASSPFGEYIPYSGTYGDTTASSQGIHYLGNKYWQSSTSVPNMKQDSGYISTFYLSPKKDKIEDTTAERYYDISDVEHQYNASTKKHRWIIWASRDKKRWYQNNQEYPILSQNYTYKYYSTDGSSKSDLTLTFKGYGNKSGQFFTDVYYYQPCRMY